MSHGDYESSPGGQPPYETPAGAGTREPGRPGLPWERRAELGPGTAVVQTISQVLRSPAATFRGMKVDGGWGEPLGFAVLVGSVSSWIAQAWIMLASSLLSGRGGPSPEEVAVANAQEIWSALLAPFLVCAFTVVGAGIVHVLLMFFGGAPRPYETTLRVFCYGWSVGVLNIVPICGVLIGAIWRLVVEVIGLREAHPVPTGRAAAAVLVPVLVSCFCLMLAFFIAGFAGIAGGLF